MKIEEEELKNVNLRDIRTLVSTIDNYTQECSDILQYTRRISRHIKILTKDAKKLINEFKVKETEGKESLMTKLCEIIGMTEIIEDQASQIDEGLETIEEVCVDTTNLTRGIQL